MMVHAGTPCRTMPTSVAIVFVGHAVAPCANRIWQAFRVTGVTVRICTIPRPDHGVER